MRRVRKETNSSALAWAARRLTHPASDLGVGWTWQTPKAKAGDADSGSLLFWRTRFFGQHKRLCDTGEV
jgi:hypothetical protein